MHLLRGEPRRSYGRCFESRNLRRMMQFAEQFLDFRIVSPLTTQLSWSHIIEVLPLKTPEARLFYLGEAATRQLGKRALRRNGHACAPAPAWASISTW